MDTVANTNTSDYVTPDQVVIDMATLGKKKASLPVKDLLIRGAMSGGLLAFATSVSFAAISEGAPPFVGALLFPVGFCILILLGFELVTGNFALIPVAVLDGKTTGKQMIRNWCWVFIGNLIGSVAYAAALYASLTKFGHVEAGPLGDVLVAKAEAKTIAYAHVGAMAGVSTAFVKAILCNWMVATGTVMALVSRTVTGKIVAMWLPIFAFFAMGFEHSVVNMFVIPAGIMFGDTVSVSDWWVWNEIIVTLGNIVGAAILVGMVLYITHGKKKSV